MGPPPLAAAVVKRGESNTTAYAYDNVGFIYDHDGRELFETGQLGNARTFAYDAARDRPPETDRDDRVRELSCDKLNRETNVPGSGSDQPTRLYWWDEQRPATTASHA